MVAATSREAFASLRPVLGVQRKKVYDLIYGRGEHGATMDEVEDVLEMRHSSVWGRLTELKKENVVVRTAQKRRTRSGRNAYVWIASAYSNR